eukprot:3935589-Rhodomonas_salina.1
MPTSTELSPTCHRSNERVSWRGEYAAEKVDQGAEQLGLGCHRLDADDVHVPLVVLALAPALHILEPPALRQRKPLERKPELSLARQHHARQARRHLRSQRDLSQHVHVRAGGGVGVAGAEADSGVDLVASFICEVVHLLCDLLPA